MLILDDLIATGGTAIAATQLLRSAGASVEHALFVIDLPDLDECVANGAATRIQDSARQMGDLTHGRRDRIIDDQQVVIGVEREFVGIKRAFGLGRRAYQFLGKYAGDQQSRRPQTHRLQKPTSVSDGARYGKVHDGSPGNRFEA